ncbi:unnamed protein product [Rodentolepis nana]|uniref:RNase H domain-containing protein n=1 Tax=Rodentolepis nana TaxID=102285 RepID=A0A0R3TWJ9_RODNA|nr:unnamed protein product [Rodentolepis nana]
MGHTWKGSLVLETINVNYPGHQWLQVFTDGSYIENQANVGAGIYSELFSFYAAEGHTRSAFEALGGLLREKNKTVVLQWIPGHCGINGNELSDALPKKGTTVLQGKDRPMPFHTIKALIRREFKTSMCNELTARAKEKE